MSIQWEAENKGRLSRKQTNIVKTSWVAISNNTHGPLTVQAQRANLKIALQNKEWKTAIMKAIQSEIDNFEEPGVVKPMKLKDIPLDLRKNIVPTFMFHVEKYKSDGSFDNDKCRMVLLSNLRDPDTIGESTSPTVNPISFMA
jgi:hypothetical protein